MAANPRIDDLRKRLQKEPGSRLFAQLAEELRKEGELDEAIRVCRDGLVKNPNYPSARMTLGRALFDNGDLPGARAEFEAVVKGAPDNILASRMLGDCLGGLGDESGARARYRLTLQMSPGDKLVQARLDALEGKAPAAQAEGPVAAAPAPGAPRVPPPAPPGVPVPPLGGGLPTPAARPAPPVRPPESPGPAAPPARPAAAVPFAVPGAQTEEPTPEAVAEAGPVEPPEPAPIPLVAVEEDFELERPSEVPEPPQAPPAKAVAPPEPPRVVERVDEYEFEDEGPATLFGMRVPATPPEPPAAAPPTIEPLDDVEYDFERDPLPKAPPAAIVEEASTLPVVPGVVFEASGAKANAAGGGPDPEGGVPPLASPTLAELYFNQGSTDKAVAVYRQLLEAEPRNLRWQARLAEIEGLDRQLRGAAAVAVGRGARREVLERTLARMEAFLSVVRREYRA